MDPGTALYIIMVGLSVYSYMNQPKPVQPVPLTLDDVNIPTAEIGGEIPVLFGTRLISQPNVIWYGDFGSSPIKSKSGK